MRGRATFTTVASRTSISWATSTIAIPVAARPALAGSSLRRSCGERVVSVVFSEEDTRWILFWPGAPGRGTL